MNFDVTSLEESKDSKGDVLMGVQIFSTLMSTWVKGWFSPGAQA